MIQPLKWHGGKHYLASRIVALMPDHSRYLEAYSGGLSVLLAKPGESVAEWANDTNGELVNFWRVIADPRAFAKFRRMAEATPLSEPHYRHASESRSPARIDSPDPSRAYLFFVRMRQSRQGLGRDYCTPTTRTRRGMNEQTSAWLSAVDGLLEVHARLRRVEIWDRPAISAIEKLDGPELLVYADPPYLHDTRSSVGEYGPHEMTVDDHVALLRCLSKMRGRFILSGYPSPLYDAWSEANGWRRVDFDLPNNASGKRTKQRKTESVWMNYQR